MEEVEEWLRRLDALGRRVDYVASHQAPTTVDSCLTGAVCEATPLTAFLDWVQQNCSFDRWFFASYHQDRLIPPKYRCLFEEVAGEG